MRPEQLQSIMCVPRDREDNHSMLAAEHRLHREYRKAPAIFWAALSLTLLARSAHPQTSIRFDGSLVQPPPALNPVTINGRPTYTITEGMGKLSVAPDNSKANLFHSFEAFSVGSGDTAKFTTTAPMLQNVISRVTGNSISTINGWLQLDGGGTKPNFFFINPNGVTFGAGAQINVPGSFHVSTANYLRLDDGAVFNAVPGPADSSLTSAAPESFGFLGGGPAPAAIRFVEVAPPSATTAPADPGSPWPYVTLTDSSTLEVAAGAIELVGTNVRIRNGRIRFVATGTSATTVGAEPLADGGFTGPITVTSSDLEVSGGSGGQIVMRGGDIEVLNERAKFGVGLGTAQSQRSLNAQTTSSVTIDATGDVSITSLLAPIALGPVTISTEGFTGNQSKGAGPILIEGASVELSNAAISSTALETVGGPIEIRSKGAISVSGNSTLKSNVSLGGQAGGDIRLISLSAGNIDIVDSTVSSSANHFCCRAGSISLETNGNVSLRGARIFATASTSADSGSIEIKGARNLFLDSKSNISVSNSNLTDLTSVLPGRGAIGSIELSASEAISIADGSRVTAENVATPTNSVSAPPGELRLITPTLILRNSSISTQASGNVGASSIIIESPRSFWGGHGDLSITVVYIGGSSA